MHQGDDIKMFSGLGICPVLDNSGIYSKVLQRHKPWIRWCQAGDRLICEFVRYWKDLVFIFQISESTLALQNLDF